MTKQPRADLQVEELDPEVVRRARAVEHAVVALPLRVTSELHVYAQSSLLLVKQLRAAGVDAVFLDPPGQRTFEMRKSADLSLVVAYAVGIASSGSWDAVKAIFRSRATKQMSVTYLDLTTKGYPSNSAWKVEGDPDAVLEAIDKLQAAGGSSKADLSTTVRLDSAVPAYSIPMSGTDDDLREVYRQRQVIERRVSGQALLASAQALLDQSNDEVTVQVPGH